MVDRRDQADRSGNSDQNVDGDIIFRHRFQLSTKMGAGSFGSVYKVTDLLNDGNRFVAKVQSEKDVHDVECSVLK